MFINITTTLINTINDPAFKRKCIQRRIRNIIRNSNNIKSRPIWVNDQKLIDESEILCGPWGNMERI